MLKRLIRKFLAPLTIDEINHMPIGAIMDTQYPLLERNSPDNYYYKERLLYDELSRQLTNVLGDKRLDIDLCIGGGDIIVRSNKFNDEIHRYIVEHKLVCPVIVYQCPIPASSPPPYFDSIHDTLEFVVRHRCNKSPDTIPMLARDIARRLAAWRHKVESLRNVVSEYEWAIPYVNRIQLRYTQGIWSVSGFEITPELLDGFISNVNLGKTSLTDEERDAWREELIWQYRVHAYGSPTAVDYNRPSIPIDTPDTWKTKYHTTIKPENERRKRCANVLHDIKGSLGLNAIMGGIAGEYCAQPGTPAIGR